ncbi:MAG: hypothetical protein HFH01_02785 [Dorea sp.]|nr:hypothetical protein [Dorea sp.]
MGIFDRLRKRKSTAPAEGAGPEGHISETPLGYKQNYTEVCRYIWKNYVPEEGQADNLQGELLREIEKLRWEAQENGNINWDEDFAYFCDFISSTLSEQPIFSDAAKDEAVSIMARLKSYGEYSRKVNDGEIPYDEIDMYRIAYVEDDLYDIICDKIARLHMENPEPVPYEKNEAICR